MDNVEERQRIGDTIRKVRKNKRITQQDLSAMLNVGRDNISLYEKGKIKVIPFEKRVKISSILDIPLTALLYEDEKFSINNGVVYDAEYGKLLQFIKSTEKSALLATIEKELQEASAKAVQENQSQVIAASQTKHYEQGRNIAIKDISRNIASVVLTNVLKNDEIQEWLQEYIYSCIEDYICSCSKEDK